MAKSRVKKRPDGRYAMQIYIGMVDGARKYKTVYGATPKEVERRAEEVRLMMGKGLDVAAMRDTVQDWAKRWVDLKAGTVSPKHAQTCAQKADMICRYIGKIPITHLRQADVQAMLLEIAKLEGRGGGGMSQRTVKEYRSVCRQICALAIDNRLMDYNPAAAVTLPAAKPPEERRALTREEQSWIINTPHRAQRAAMIMMFSGLRRGELIPLTWGDVDLSTATITVNKSVEFVGNKPRVKRGTKRHAEGRVVNIPDILVRFLEDQRKDSVFVCPAVNGGMLTPSSWRIMWDSYLRELNLRYGGFPPGTSKYTPHGLPMRIEPITPHMLRHTFCTLLYYAGVDVVTARDQMGHTDISTTLKIYTHLDAQHKQEAAQKLNSYLAADASQMQVNKS